MATMTTMFNSLYYHIISRCSTYNSRPPPPAAGPLMFALCFDSKNVVKTYTIVQCCYYLLGLTIRNEQSTSDNRVVITSCNISPYLSVLIVT